MLLTTHSQKSETELKHFEQDYLSFAYPADWSIVDYSTPEETNLSVTQSDRSARISIIVRRKAIFASQYEHEERERTVSLVAGIAREMQGRKDEESAPPGLNIE